MLLAGTLYGLVLISGELLLTLYYLAAFNSWFTLPIFVLTIFLFVGYLFAAWWLDRKLVHSFDWFALRLNERR